MKPDSEPPCEDPKIAEQASLWLTRRDSGLTPAEQDAYLQWLNADPRHAEALAQHAATLERMMQLCDWQPGQSSTANPDLFAPPRRPIWRHWGTGMAAAAALILGGALLWRTGVLTDPVDHPKSYLHVNEQRALPDGSVVELKNGSRIIVEFSPSERRVQLVGEANFKVAKNPTPFVVVGGGVALRAVGTVFNARCEADAVEVFVLEGRVAVARLHSEDEVSAAGDERAGSGQGKAGVSIPADGRWFEVAAGQCGSMPLASDAKLRVRDVPSDEAKSLIEWQAPRLQFFETPLEVAIGEFNQRNRVQLVLGQDNLGRVPIGGTFRVDNPEGFVRVLELTLEIKSVRRDDREIVLLR
jgi:transmembrane sensor